MPGAAGVCEKVRADGLKAALGGFGELAQRLKVFFGTPPGGKRRERLLDYCSGSHVAFTNKIGSILLGGVWVLFFVNETNDAKFQRGVPFIFFPLGVRCSNFFFWPENSHPAGKPLSQMTAVPL